MTLPLRYEGNHSSNLVCKLKKSLYGLKQSPRAWFESNDDHTLFFKHYSSGGLSVLLIYVDDIIITGNDDKEIQNLSNCLVQEFDVKTLGRLKYFLGIKVAHSSKDMFISQRKYIIDLLARTEKSVCKPANTPIDPNQKLLFYLTHTQPDISHAVSILSQFMYQPKEYHLHAAYRVLHYLKGTPGKGVLFNQNEKVEVEMFTDANYASSMIDRRSTSGHVTFFGSNLVTWRSKNKMALAQGICELLWVKNLLDELQIPLFSPMKIYCDNKSAVNLMHNPVQHDHTKHMEIDRHFIKKKLEPNVICISYILINNQLADILTKGISGTQRQKIILKLGMDDIPSPA
ncbi:unnamed protein product [Spirodela intermedia]|uniref:Reverse transcriptase Ty1/copia-type domain-containing protein n=1 Tax=Spirodela intermedia TaxID=51605 RepID=A0A7I8J1N9_SPIIN|nr:unnamed protein product [Spirodela intermedia]CAA6664134.1 unnamed protein product [Spirodela intermedia]